MRRRNDNCLVGDRDNNILRINYFVSLPHQTQQPCPKQKPTLARPASCGRIMTGIPSRSSGGSGGGTSISARGGKSISPTRTRRSRRGCGSATASKNTGSGARGSPSRRSLPVTSLSAITPFRRNSCLHPPSRSYPRR